MPGTLHPYSPEAMARVSLIFAGTYPDPVRLWAMLDGIISARLLADNAEAPTWVLLQELAEGTVYVGGEIAPELLGAAIHTLRQVQDVVIGAWPDDDFATELLPPANFTGVAVDFTNRSPEVDLVPLTAVPTRYELRRIEPTMAPLLDGFDYYIAMFGSVEAALQGTIGYCVLHEGDIVAEAVAGPFARGTAEIGVGTKPQHRGLGLATAAAARVIQTCEELGCRPLWNAAQHNAPSVALARRLGFVTEQPFQVYAWSQSSVSS
jgi:RimJ/RimL family protein N-acetyltransferase